MIEREFPFPLVGKWSLDTKNITRVYVPKSWSIIGLLEGMCISAKGGLFSSLITPEPYGELFIFVPKTSTNRIPMLFFLVYIGLVFV